MAEPISTVVLGLVAKSFISALIGKSSEQLWSKLKGDATSNAFKHALGIAIQRYATSGSRLDLAQPLLQKDSPLKKPEIAAELTQLIRFEREPNAELIGTRWKATLDNPPAWRNFTAEAELFLNYLQAELQSTDVFRPVFEAKSLVAIATSSAISAESLTQLESQLINLSNLLDARFGQLIRVFAEASPSIRDQIYDYSRLVEEKTRGFVGRKFVFDAVNQFIHANPRGYFLIQGDPGIGKSAWAAQMVKTTGCVHHFNVRAEGINNAANFLKNICAQLIAAHNLTYSTLPPQATQDAGFLTKVLEQVSEKLDQSQKAVIVVDALDEADTAGLAPGVNPLYLPQMMPPGVYIVVTTRRTPINLRIECEQGTFQMKSDSADNIADVSEFIQQSLKRPGIQAYMAAQAIGDESFVSHLIEKSQANFMYLRYVLPEIESGAYKDLELGAIPIGLQNYYNDHWHRLRGQDEEVWFKYKLPVLVALTVSREPISIDLISDFSRAQQRSRIRTVLTEWSQFLHEEQVEYEAGFQKRYRIYHSSFYDFIASKEDVADEHVDLKAARTQIADRLWKDSFGNEQLF